jgi:protein-S-isoprenylcysteine O-methyltransferase Ste14
MERSLSRVVMTGKAELMLVIVLSTIAYLGLAILGSGGLGAFFGEPSRSALAVATLALAGAALFSGGRLGSGMHEDRTNRWVVVPFTLIGLLVAYLPAYTERQQVWIVGGDAVRWVGVGLFTIGGALRIWPIFVLGNRFSGLVAIQPGHTLVTTGIYSVIRNPSYLGFLINVLGWSLAFRSGVGLLLTAFLVPPLLSRIGAEEALLRAKFGLEYESYCSRTWRLIPGLY